MGRGSTHVDTAFMGLTSSGGVTVACKLPARSSPLHPFSPPTDRHWKAVVALTPNAARPTPAQPTAAVVDAAGSTPSAVVPARFRDRGGARPGGRWTKAGAGGEDAQASTRLHSSRLRRYGMRQHDRLYIGGEWVAPAGTGTIDVISPHTEEVIGRVPDATPADIDREVAAAREAFDNGPWPRMAPAERAAVLGGLTALLGERMPELSELITEEMGAPITFSQLGQTGQAHAVYSYFTELSIDWEEERAGMLGPVTVRREPVGVVAAIVPWNVPQFIIALKLAPALIAGCTIVIKPAPETPLDGYPLADMLTEAGVPKGVVSIVAAGRETGEHLVRHPGVDKVAFTGSTAAGRPHPR